MSGKLPSIHLYPGDWLRDPVAGCSLEAQGLWLRMIFLGHDSDRYGYLAVNGVPIPPESIARRCGCTLEQYTTLLAELDMAGVPSRTPEGTVFSRRMVKDANERMQGSERVKRLRMKRSCNAPCNGDVTPNEDEADNEDDSEGVSVKGSAEGKLHSTRFIPPELPEVRLLFEKGGCPVETEIEKFYGHYGSNGWRVGKNPMRSVPHAVGGWIARWRSEGGDRKATNGRKGQINSHATYADDKM